MNMFLIRAGLIVLFSILLTGINACMNVFDKQVEAAVKVKIHNAQIEVLLK
jgi:hypothetical protein